MPHVAKSIVHLEHDLRRLTTPAKLKHLLPDMTSMAMDDSIWNASKELSDHICFVILRDNVEGLLDDMAPENIHTQI